MFKRNAKTLEIQKGLKYMYAVVGLQLLFLFGLILVTIIIGKVFTTPWWVFAIGFGIVVGGGCFIYYRIKRQFRKFKETMQEMNLSNRGYEIKIMNGALTMRVGQSSDRLLEAPEDQPAIEAKVTDIRNYEKISRSGTL